jgi:hypothetical protein
MRHFLEIVRLRKTLTLEMQALILEYWRSVEARREMLNDENQLKDQLSVASANRIGDLDTFANLTLRRLKNDTMRALSMQARSLAYWSLSPAAVTFRDERIEFLGSTAAALKTETVRQLEHFNGAAQRFTTHRPIVISTRSHPEAFRVFKETGRLNFAIEPSDDVFRNLCVVLVSKCTVAFSPGNSKLVQVKMVHHGDATLVSQTRQHVKFLHPPRVGSAWATIKVANATADIDLGGLENRFAFLSPFASWTLELSNDNRGISLSTVSQFAVSFDGFAYTLP